MLMLAVKFSKPVKFVCLTNRRKITLTNTVFFFWNCNEKIHSLYIYIFLTWKTMPCHHKILQLLLKKVQPYNLIDYLIYMYLEEQVSCTLTCWGKHLYVWPKHQKKVFYIIFTDFNGSSKSSISNINGTFREIYNDKTIYP